MIGGADGIRKSAHVGGKRDHLNLCENALLIAEFVNARAKTTIGDIREEFGLDRRSASQCLRRLWVGGLIGKRARGLFVPATSSPAFSAHTEDNDDSEQTEVFVGTVGTDDVEDTERVEDSRVPDDNDESGDTLQSGDGAQPEDTEDAQLVDHEVPSASGFGVTDDSDDRSLTDDSGASDGIEQSEDFDDTAASEDSEDCSASAELTSGSHFTAVSKADLRCHVPKAIVRSARAIAVSRSRAASSVAVRQPPLCLDCNLEHAGECL